MKKEFNVMIERDPEGFYIGSVPELKSCHTQAKSLEYKKLLWKYEPFTPNLRKGSHICIEKD